MKERVVYLLGAGFSAGMGLPVTANFLTQARDLREQFPGTNNILGDVIDRIEELSRIKNVFRCDLFNIEEALSIVEFDELAAEKLPPESIRSFIEHVIKARTPQISKPASWSGGDLKKAVGSDRWHLYASFAIGLFGKRVTTVPGTSYLQCEPDSAAKARYSVITLNYDRILESVCDLTKEHPFEKRLAISFDSVGLPTADAPALVKLHGSIGQEILVPPTWQKVLHPEVKPLMKRAHALLREANHLRIIGYSLPATDSYVPYLLKAGLRTAPNLKSIDVLCLDKEDEVKKRYDTLIDFHGYRFLNEDVLNYFDSIASRIESGAGFESGHNYFFGRSTADHARN